MRRKKDTTTDLMLTLFRHFSSNKIIDNLFIRNEEMKYEPLTVIANYKKDDRIGQKHKPPIRQIPGKHDF